jgi:hypothetical protein
MSRNRLTWQQRTADRNKKASPPPQMPAVGRTEDPSHPAYYEDPEADKYQTGDTSAFAEDPHSPMDPESAPPAMPGNMTTMELSHPATSSFQKSVEKPSAGSEKQASSLKEMAERRAALCVRIASALMPGADVSSVEDRALKLMDLDERQLQATLETIKLTAGEEMEMEMDEEMDDDMDEEMSKAASHMIAARLDNIEASIGKLVQAMTDFFGMAAGDRSLLAAMMNMDDVNVGDADGDGVNQNDSQYGYSDKQSMDDFMAMDDDEEESMLRAMLEEMESEEEEEMAPPRPQPAQKEAMHVEDVTGPLTKGKGVQNGAGGNVNPSKQAETPQVEGPQKGDTAVKSAGENDVDMSSGDDPMGLIASERADRELLALYSDMDLGKTAMDEDEDMEDEDDELAKKAGEDEMELDMEDELELKPQGKTAGHVGPRTLGNVGISRTASSDVSELEKLWDSAPDVSAVFGVPKP